MSQSHTNPPPPPPTPPPTTTTTTTTHFPYVVLGSGQAGGPLAQSLASLSAATGQKTLLIESTHVGGTCVNEGCTPTKTMVASARVAYLARRGRDYGVVVGNAVKSEKEQGKGELQIVEMDMKTVRRRKREIVNSFRGGSERRIKGTEGLELWMGRARFVGMTKAVLNGGEDQRDDEKGEEKEVGVVVQIEVVMNDSSTTSNNISEDSDGKEKRGETRQITASKIFVNAGCFPSPLQIPGGIEKIDSDLILNSTSVMELDVVPSHLLVLGGGYVGVEFAQMFRRFGANVTIIQRAAQLLGREDEDVADAVRQILVDDGIEVLLSTTVSRVEEEEEEVGTSRQKVVKLTVTMSNGTTRTLTGSHLLAAAGRTPATAGLNLEAVGVEVDGHGFIKTDETLQTTNPAIWALGDIKGGPQFTHISYDDYRIVRDNLIKPAKTGTGTGTGTTSSQGHVTTRTVKHRMVPYTVFMDPQLGRIGLTETEARRQAAAAAKSIKVAKMPMAYVARALEMDESRGLIKVVVDADSGRILGAAVLGIEGGEVMTMLQLAMMGGLTWNTMQDAVFAHPGLGELLNNLWGFLE